MNETRNISKKRYSRKEEVVFRRIADEKLLIPVSGRLANMQNIFIINSVAEFVWDRLDGAITVESIIQDLLDSYEVDRQTAENDVSSFIEKLAEFDLIEEEGTIC